MKYILDSENLSEAERKAAWEEYENEKKGVVNMVNTSNLNIMNNGAPAEFIRILFETIENCLSIGRVENETLVFIDNCCGFVE